MQLKLTLGLLHPLAAGASSASCPESVSAGEVHEPLLRSSSLWPWPSPYHCGLLPVAMACVVRRVLRERAVLGEDGCVCVWGVPAGAPVGERHHGPQRTSGGLGHAAQGLGEPHYPPLSVRLSERMGGQSSSFSIWVPLVQVVPAAPVVFVVPAEAAVPVVLVV